MFDRLGKAWVYSKSDLKSGFYPIWVWGEKIWEKWIKNTYEHYEFLVIPMSLCKVPAAFQTLMNSIFHINIDNFMNVYLEHLSVYSNSFEKHIEHLDIVFFSTPSQQALIGKRKVQTDDIRDWFFGPLSGFKMNNHWKWSNKNRPRLASPAKSYPFARILWLASIFPTFYWRFLPDRQFFIFSLYSVLTQGTLWK